MSLDSFISEVKYNVRLSMHGFIFFVVVMQYDTELASKKLKRKKGMYRVEKSNKHI